VSWGDEHRELDRAHADYVDGAGPSPAVVEAMRKVVLTRAGRALITIGATPSRGPFSSVAR